MSPRYTNNNGSIRLWINGTNYINCTTNIGYDPSLVSGAYDGLDIKNGMYQPNANNGHTVYFDQIMFADTFNEAAAMRLPRILAGDFIVRFWRLEGGRRSGLRLSDYSPH